MGIMGTVKSFREFKLQDALAYFQKLDRPTRKKFLMGGIGALAFLVFIFWPAWFERPMIQGRINVLRTQVQTAETQARLEPQLLEQRKKYEDSTRALISKLPTEGEIQRLLGILSSLGEKSQVTILSSQPEEREGAKIPKPFDQKYLSASYSLTVEGGYHALATFVSEIENYSRLLRVDELSISPQEEAPATHICELKISAFSLKGGK